MKVSFAIGGRNYSAALDRPLHISIPVRFDGEQLSAFGAPPAKKEAYKAGGFTGSVAHGGSCNCEVYTLNPHCNGTHTESVGHLMQKPLAIHEALRDSIMPAALVSVMPERAAACGESYGAMQPDDLVITKRSLEGIPAGRDIAALVVRTLPNGDDKPLRQYGDAMPPYFTSDAMEFIATGGIRHLLADVPSVDRLDDGGTLGNHRIFWGVAAGETNAASSPKTITELIYVPDSISAGLYLLNLQVAAFMADAAPSRPILYEVTPA